MLCGPVRCLLLVTPPLIHTFNFVLERVRHSIERTLELCAHKEPDYICEQTPEKLPRLVYGFFTISPSISQDLPAFCVDQPACGRCEAPRQPETRGVDASQYLLGRGRLGFRIVHCGWHVEP